MKTSQNFKCCDILQYFCLASSLISDSSWMIDFWTGSFWKRFLTESFKLQIEDSKIYLKTEPVKTWKLQVIPMLPRRRPVLGHQRAAEV